MIRLPEHRYRARRWQGWATFATRLLLGRRGRGRARAGLWWSTIGRSWKAFRLKPHLADGFKVSTGPLFIGKVRDVAGLYLNPPEHAVVLCADEKSQVRGPGAGPWLGTVAGHRGWALPSPVHCAGIFRCAGMSRCTGMSRMGTWEPCRSPEPACQ